MRSDGSVDFVNGYSMLCIDPILAFDPYFNASPYLGYEVLRSKSGSWELPPSCIVFQFNVAIYFYKARHTNQRSKYAWVLLRVSATCRPNLGKCQDAPNRRLLKLSSQIDALRGQESNYSLYYYSNIIL